MKEVELTGVRAIKVFWSFTWRAWLLMVPLMIVWLIGIKLIVPFPQPTPTGGNINLFQTLAIMMMWFVMFPIMLALQVVALRWALKVHWSDFRLAVIATELVPPPPLTQVRVDV